MAKGKTRKIGQKAIGQSLVFRRPHRPRNWTARDTSESQAQAAAFLHVLQDAAVCGALPRGLKNRPKTAQRKKQSPAAPPPPNLPQRWRRSLRAPNPDSIPIANRMVTRKGTATEQDRVAVVEHLAVFPPEFLEHAHNVLKVGVIACRNSVTDAKPEGRGVRPRGWPEGQTWDTVPGMADPQTKMAIVATKAGPNGTRIPSPTGHGSFNLVGHEFLHAFNFGRNENGRGTVDPRFRAARLSVLSRIASLPKPPDAMYNLPYYQQPDVAGRQESHAESGCRWFYGDPLIRTSEVLAPLADFWQVIERELGVKG